MSSIRLAADIGGTFTDIALEAHGEPLLCRTVQSSRSLAHRSEAAPRGGPWRRPHDWDNTPISIRVKALNQIET